MCIPRLNCEFILKIKKLKSKLEAVRQDLVIHDGELDSQGIQHLSTQERLKQELKTKTEQVEKMKQKLSELKAHGELTEHGWSTVAPEKGEIKAYQNLKSAKPAEES